MTMNETKVIDKTDKTNDLIIIDPKNFGEKIKKILILFNHMTCKNQLMNHQNLPYLIKKEI